MNLSYDTGIEEKIKEKFEEDIKDALCIELKDIDKQSTLERIIENVARIISPLL